MTTVAAWELCDTCHHGPLKLWGRVDRESSRIRRVPGSSALGLVISGKQEQNCPTQMAPLSLSSSRRWCSCTAVVQPFQCLSWAKNLAFSIQICLYHFYSSKNNMISLSCLPCHCLALFILPGVKPWHFCWILREKSFFLFHLNGKAVTERLQEGTGLAVKGGGVRKESTNLSTGVGFLMFFPTAEGFCALLPS